MSTQLQTIGNFTQDDITTMQATIAKGTTPAQFNLFIRTAAASGLNPFLNHIYCIVYGQTMNIQISVEGIVFLAKKVEGFQGIDVQLVHDNDEFEASIDKEGKWSIDAHKFKFPRGKVIGGYAIAYRDGFKPFTVFMEVSEVEHNLKGNNKALWEKYFNDFFKKHMVKRAAKGQFGVDISEDDNGNASSEVLPEYKPTERKDITAEANHTNAPKQPEPEVKVDPLKQAMDDIQEKFKLIGIHDKDKRTQFYKENQVKMDDWKNPTLKELQGILLLLDQKIADNQAEDEVPLLVEE